MRHWAADSGRVRSSAAAWVAVRAHPSQLTVIGQAEGWRKGARVPQQAGHRMQGVGA
jgi:hypothetical protein